MKEDMFSNSSIQNTQSIFEDKNLSQDILNSQFDGNKTTNAPQSNDKQTVENEPKDEKGAEQSMTNDRKLPDASQK